MFQKNVTNNHRTFIIQPNSSTYQRKGNQELEVQLLNMIVADLQNQIKNINTSSPLLIIMKPLYWHYVKTQTVIIFVKV